jgi:signal peptidase I
MKTYFKVLLGILVSASLFCSGFFVAYKTIKKDKEVVKTVEVKEVVKDRFAGAKIQKIQGVGNSMLPTLADGQIYYGYKIEPQEGDIIAFNSTKYLEGVKQKDLGGGAVKRLIKTREDGAYWVLGDNRSISHDSGDFGWILPSEISDIWVVKVK